MNKLLVTVLMSTVVSSVVSGLIGYGFAHNRDNTTGRFSKIEIVDPEGRTRAALGTTGANGIYVPQLIMGADIARPSIILTTNSGDDVGTLFFSSRTREGKVSVGYLNGSDAIDTRPNQLGNDDPLGGWGLRVSDQDGKALSLAVLNTGRVIEPEKPSLK